MNSIPVFVASLLVLLVLFNTSFAQQSSSKPKKLGVYYGWPSVVNGSQSTNEAANVFNYYDLIIFGLDLESTSHPDHYNTKTIIQNINSSTEVFGYVPVGRTLGLSIDEIKLKINHWQDSMNVDGIFIDEAGYDFGVSRIKQNEIISYVHSLGLKLFINAWKVNDIFGDDIVYSLGDTLKIDTVIQLGLVENDTRREYEITSLNHGFIPGDSIKIIMDNDFFEEQYYKVRSTSEDGDKFIIDLPLNLVVPTSTNAIVGNLRNPNGSGTVIQSGDIYLMESFQIEVGKYHEWAFKAHQAKEWADSLGVEIACLTTNQCLNEENPVSDYYNCSSTSWNCLDGTYAFNQQKINFAWWSSYIYDFDYFGWGEANGFSTWGPCNALLYERGIPDPQFYNNTPGNFIVDDFDPISSTYSVPQITTNGTELTIISDNYHYGDSSVTILNTQFKAKEYSSKGYGYNQSSFSFKSIDKTGLPTNFLHVNTDPGVYPDIFSRNYQLNNDILTGNTGIRVAFFRLNYFLRVQIILKKNGSNGWYFIQTIQQNEENPIFEFEFDSGFTPSNPSLPPLNQLLNEVDQITFKVLYSGLPCNPAECEGFDYIVDNISIY